MKRSLFRVSAIIFSFSALMFFTACGPTAQQREEQRIEDSLRLDLERRELLERTGRMIDSIRPAPTDSPQ